MASFNIDIPVTLTGEVTRLDDDYRPMERYEVIVKFGGEEITRLPTDREVDSYGLDEVEELYLMEESVAKWLREKLA